MSSPISSRNSYDQLLATRNDDSAYQCECGEAYMTQETLQRHQQTNCKNRSFQCVFCNELFSSSARLRDHLLLCGNKTDQCPNCLKLIRRSHFSYHYENNCAPIDDVETPPIRPKNQHLHRVPVNSNRPVLRVDVPSDDDRQNIRDRQISMNPSRGNIRIQPPPPPPPPINQRNSPILIECEYCHHRCTQNDYNTHKERCLQNPANINNRSPLRVSSEKPQNQHSSSSIVHIPCEICNQPVDLPNWSKHTQTCRERANQRLASRAQMMSNEPVTEKLPCEYCQQLQSAVQLVEHQRNCLNNPNNVESAARLANPRPSHIILPRKPNNNGSRRIPINDQLARNQGSPQYQSIDVDRTHHANRSLDDDRSNNQRDTQPLIRRAGSDETLLRPGRSRNDLYSYDNEPIRSNGNPSQLHRDGVSGGIARHDGTREDDRSRVHNDHRDNHHLRHGYKTFEVINNQPNRPMSKKPKQSALRKFFCGTDSGNVSD